MTQSPPPFAGDAPAIFRYRYLIGAGVALVMTLLVTTVSFLLSSPFLEREASKTTIVGSECLFNDNDERVGSGAVDLKCVEDSQEDPIFAFFEKFLTPGSSREDEANQRQIGESVRSGGDRP